MQEFIWRFMGLRVQGLGIFSTFSGYGSPYLLQNVLGE